MKKEIIIDWSESEGFDKIEIKGKVILKKLNFSEKNALEEESTDIKMIGQTPQVKVSTSKLKELALLKGIMESSLVKTVYVSGTDKKPSPMNTEYPLKSITDIKGLPLEIGEQLFEEWTAINTLDVKKNIN